SCISGVNRGHRNVGRRAWRGCLGAHRIGGRKSADRPTPAPSVGWSTPRVGHQVGLRCPPYRRPEQRRPPYPRAALVGRTTPRVVRRKRSRYSPIGGRNSADRPTPAPSVGWSTPRVGHQVGLRCPPYRGPEQRRPPYPRAILVGWSTPRVGHRVGLRCPPYRRPEQRRPPYARAILVGGSTPALATRRGFGAHRIGGREGADRPTPAPSL